MEYFGYNGILCMLEWMCGLFQDNLVVEVCSSGGYGIVVSHSPIYDSA